MKSEKFIEIMQSNEYLLVDRWQTWEYFELYFAFPYLKTILYALVNEVDEVLFFWTQLDLGRFWFLSIETQFDSSHIWGIKYEHKRDDAYCLVKTNQNVWWSHFSWIMLDDVVEVRSPCVIYINDEKDMIYLLTSFIVYLEEWSGIGAYKACYDSWYENYFHKKK